MKSLSYIIICSMVPLFLSSGCEKSEQDVSCDDYNTSEFTVIVHNNSSGVVGISGRNQELLDDNNFRECVPNGYHVDFEGEDDINFHVPGGTSKQVSTKTWTKEKFPTIELCYLTQCVQVSAFNGATIELNLDSDGNLTLGSGSGGGSGMGSLVAFSGCGRIVPTGFGFHDCGGYTYALIKSGTVVGEEHVTTYHCYTDSEAFCGIVGAATFENIPMGYYKVEERCGSTVMKTYNVNIKEDECYKRKFL